MGERAGKPDIMRAVAAGIVRLRYVFLQLFLAAGNLR